MFEQSPANLTSLSSFRPAQNLHLGSDSFQGVTSTAERSDLTREREEPPGCLGTPGVVGDEQYSPSEEENHTEPPGYPGHHNHLQGCGKKKECGNAFR
jgi:hypothetical protein